VLISQFHYKKKKYIFAQLKNTKMSENLENANELIEKIKSNKTFKLAAIAVGAVVVLVLGYVAYYNFVYLPAEEKSHTAYWRELIMVENDSLDVALDGFESIAKQYDGKTGGEVSNYMAGRILMEKGQFEDALKYLEKVDLEDVYLGSMVIGLQGDCYVELKKFDQAVKLYEEAASRKPNEMTTPMYLKKAALVYELELKNFEKATELYKQIELDYYEYAKSNNIEKYIARASNKQ
jgi:tetratricopeptide (TPR) repeat protein